MNAQRSGAKVFISYSHADEAFLEKLRKHASVLIRSGLVTIWDDHKIVPGHVIDDQISKAMLVADIFVLMVSSDFLASEYCIEKELNFAMQRHESGIARVVPIIVRSCDWTHCSFSHILALPKEGHEITKWDNEDEAFKSVIDGLRKLLGDLNFTPTPKKPITAVETKPLADAADFTASGPTKKHSPLPSGLITTAIDSFIAHLATMDCQFEVSSNFSELSLLRAAMRGDKPSPMFDVQRNQLNERNAFWTRIRRGDDTLSVQAFRLIDNERPLSEWVYDWMVESYAARQEKIVPATPFVSPHSLATKLYGRGVYHGEMWIDKTARNRQIFDVNPRLGMLLCFMRFRPNYIWGLAGNMFAIHGFGSRSGYTHIEENFLRWTVLPEGADSAEWLLALDHDGIELIIENEMIRLSGTKSNAPYFA